MAPVLMSAELRKAQQAYGAALLAAERLRAARDAQVRADLAAGFRQREVMDDTGLSRGRVDQIRRGTR